MRRASAGIVVVACVLFSRGAFAQPAPPERAAAAQALYDKAVEAMDKAHDYATACPQLEEVVRLVPEGVGAKFTLAECYEGLGKLASAWVTYTTAESAADAAKQPERAKKARDRAAGLRSRLAELTLLVPPNVRALPGLEITRDGIPVGAPLFGVAIPVDKGAHTVVVSSGGRSMKKTVTIASDGEKRSITLEGPASPEQEQPAPLPPAPDAPGFWTTRRAIGAGIGSLGVVGLGVSFAFGAQAISKKNESNAGPCDATDHCTPAGLQLRADGRSAGTVATAFFVIGVAATGAGIVVLATAPSPSAGVEARVGPGSFVVRGSF